MISRNNPPLIDGKCNRPKTGKRPSWWLIVHGLVGLGALIWFLIRVIPKPSRASYPCQRVAFPIASSLVIWLVGILSSIAILRKTRRHLQNNYYLAAALGFALAVGILWTSLNHTLPQTARAMNANDLPGHVQNAPIGTPQGIHPGRVVWVHEPNATDWEYSDDGHPWDLTHTSQADTYDMLAEAVRSLTGEDNTTSAWTALFRYFNQHHGRGDVGYQPGEKIVIKINLTTCNINQDASNVDSNYDKKNSSYLNNSDTSPALIVAVLKQLVEIAGVDPNDIWVGDTLCYFPKQWWDICHGEYPDVHYFDYRGTFGREKLTTSSIIQYWSGEEYYNSHLKDHVPNAYAEATYLINLPVLKSHGSGITLCAKNNYGSYMRSPGYDDHYFNLHNSLSMSMADRGNDGGNPYPAQYRALVDIMGHPHMGGKTLLYLIDGLYAGQGWKGEPHKFQMQPFNNDWPSSLLASQDPVAIDSVGLDFLLQEWPDQVLLPPPSGSGEPIPAVDDYLHEAAQANNPPSGTFYDPLHDGIGLSSLGVHEHWNNPIDKQYSRNLGTGSGIELIATNITNRSPQVTASCGDVLIYINQPVHIEGSVIDDGLPSIPGTVTTHWSQASGPGTASFDDEHDPNTTVTFDTSGLYVLRLTADDGQEFGFDEITILVPEPIELSLSQFIATPGSTPGTDRCQIRGTMVFEESQLSIGTHIALQIGPWSEIITLPNPYIRHVGSGHNYMFNGPTSQGAQLMIMITNGNKFSLTLRNADLAGLQSPVTVRISGGNFHAIATVTTPQNIKFLKGVQDTLRFTSSSYRSGGAFNMRGFLAAESYQEIMASVTIYLNDELLAHFPAHGETSPLRKLGAMYLYVRNRTANPSGKVDMALFNLDTGMVLIQGSRAPALTGTITAKFQFMNVADEVFFEATDSFSVP